MIILLIIAISLIHSSLKVWQNVLFELGSERVNTHGLGYPLSASTSLFAGSVAQLLFRQCSHHALVLMSLFYPQCISVPCHSHSASHLAPGFQVSPAILSGNYLYRMQSSSPLSLDLNLMEWLYGTCNPRSYAITTLLFFLLSSFSSPLPLFSEHPANTKFFSITNELSCFHSRCFAELERWSLGNMSADP